MRKKQKMNTKNLTVIFCTFALALFLVANVSAAEITTDYKVTVNDIQVLNSRTMSGISNPILSVANGKFSRAIPIPSQTSVVAGEEFLLKVFFTSNVYDTDVTLEATVEGEKVDFTERSMVFDVEKGRQYRKVLILKVPYELKDKVSDILTLSIKLDGKDHKTVFRDIILRVQRPSYNAAIKSITTPSSINAGEEFPVEIVLKNIGYNDLEDVYASARIVDLGVSQGPKWFGDLVSLDCNNRSCNEDDTDTAVGKLYLKVPYGVNPGVYTLEVVVENDDVRTVETKQIFIGNDFTNNIFVTNSKMNVAIGEEVSYNLLIVNPTDNVKVYKISMDGNVLTASQTIVAVSAGSSVTVKISGVAEEKGLFTYNVNVFDGETIVKTIPLEMNVEGNASTDTIVVLTIVLAIIFLVLLVVLIVLLTKKPEKKEDFGESYY